MAVSQSRDLGRSKHPRLRLDLTAPDAASKKIDKTLFAAMVVVMDLSDESTWPSDLLAYLERHRDLFRAWEEQSQGSPSTVSARDYDQALLGLRPVLNNHALHGYHCARLTASEIQHIRLNGMQLPNGAMLRRRIGSIRDDKLIDPEVARHLMEKNQGDDANRANRIHFCFFEPHMAGETGINSLLRYWGGEALYNSHDADPVRGLVLAKVGIPCLVEADVPIVDLKGIFLDINVSRQFLIWRGLRPLEIIKHSDCAVRPVRSLRRVVQFPESDFIALTQCETWETPLT